MSGNFTAVPIPATMAHLPKDKRGYPIPNMVWIDDHGTPHFTINAEETRQKALREELCSICGKKLFRGKFLVGGPLSAISSLGRYLDPPMHRECATYALTVCPYLAAPRYTGLIDVKKVPENQMGRVFTDPTMIKERPPCFVLIGVPRVKLHKGILSQQTGARVIGWQYIEPKGEVIAIEFWNKGQRITEAEAQPFIEEAFSHAHDGNAPRRSVNRSGGKKRADRPRR